MAISIVVLAWRRRRPALLVGWFWYLGMLVPVIGLVQVGIAGDGRPLYLLAADWPVHRAGLGMLRSHRVLALSPLGVRRRFGLGAGDSDGVCLATDHLLAQQRNTLDPRRGMHARATPWPQQPWLFLDRGRLDEAIGEYRKNRGNDAQRCSGPQLSWPRPGRQWTFDEAIAQYRKALEIRPDYPEAHNHLGNALAGGGRLDEAIADYRKALKIKPDFAEAHSNLGNVLARQGRSDEAIVEYRTALKVNPDYADAYNNLAWLRATSLEASIRNGKEAVELGPASGPAFRWPRAEFPCDAGRRLCRSGPVSRRGENGAQGPGPRHATEQAGPGGIHQGRFRFTKRGRPFVTRRVPLLIAQCNPNVCVEVTPHDSHSREKRLRNGHDLPRRRATASQTPKSFQAVQDSRSPFATANSCDVYAALAICGFLLLAVGLVFGQTVHHVFVNYDDPRYVYENSYIIHGQTVEKIAWAFTSSYAANWHPLTWLSHILDYQLYGLYAGGHHATNVLLHAAMAILLFLVLRRMTGDLGPAPSWRPSSPFTRCGWNRWPGWPNERMSSAGCSSC